MQNVLLITYFFPPAANVGVRRIFQFAKYLGDYDWNSAVLTVRTKDYRATDDTETHLNALPSTIKIHRTRCWDPYNLVTRDKTKTSVHTSLWDTFLYWIRANIFIPDAYIGWIPFAIYRGFQLLRIKKMDAIVTSGPPHSTHFIGLILSKYYKIPWIVDFRDPWDFAYYERRLEHFPAKIFNHFLQWCIVKHASKIISVTNNLSYANTVKAQTPYVIINGYNPADFHNMNVKIRKDNFILSYIGTTHHDCNVEPFLRAIKTLHEANRCPQLHVEFTGNVHHNLLQNIEQLGIQEMFSINPYTRHSEAIQRMCNSSLLLLFMQNQSQLINIVPSKLYEYLASSRPILAIGAKDSSVARILHDAKAGTVFQGADHDAICKYILKHYTAWKSGRPITGATMDDISQYNCITQTKALADQLDALV